MNNNLPIIFTAADEEQFLNERFCYYCGEPLKYDCVRDHDHLTGKYRGAAHNKCNLATRQDKYVPVIFHNLSHYDVHLFIKTLSKKKTRHIKVLAKSAEEYISFEFGCLRFIDSYRFLQSSLDNITKSMVDGDFNITFTALWTKDLFVPRSPREIGV